MSESKTTQTLLTSKKKVETGKWSYRGFLLEKNGTKWVAKLMKDTNLPEEKTDSIIDELMTSAKNICLRIDSILGPLTESESIKPKRATKTAAQRLQEKEEKSRFVERAQRIAYDIRNSINILTCLEQKKIYDKVSGNELISNAPNLRKTLKNGYKIGWENGCLYNVPEITEEIQEILNKDLELIEEFKSKHTDLNINFNVNDNKIDIEVTYKE
jgi:hypothetical protein